MTARRALSGGWRCLGAAALLAVAAGQPASSQAPESLPAYSPVKLTRSGEKLSIRWPAGGGRTGELALDLRMGSPLIESLGIGTGSGKTRPLLKRVEPLLTVTVGSRAGENNRPPAMSVFNAFFDNPATRPHQTHLGRFRPGARIARISSEGGARSDRARISIDGLEAGPFAGTLELTVYSGSPLVRMDAALTTNAERVAYYYDLGLSTEQPNWPRMAWMDTEGRLQREAVELGMKDRPLAVRHRTLMAEGESGTVACFPAPHQFFFPRDYTDNLKNLWSGRDHNGQSTPWGFGIRQTATGGGNYSPWISAPPGTRQRMGVFYLLSPGKAEQALKETLRYTHNDRFVPVPGHKTFTSHYHLAMTMEALKRRSEGRENQTPEWVTAMREMGVESVHLGEFHGDGHQKDSGEVRLAEMAAMFRECRRLSDDRFLVMPGEEADEYLGAPAPGRQSGHWNSFFPREVYWTMRRAPGKPMVETHPVYGKVYNVGSRDEAHALLEKEGGLAWTTHPRIKASIWSPDAFRHLPFYQSEQWLGGAWKAMPADLSRERLGERCLDLLDDMANWGTPKYLPGEVDVFKIDHTHELYGHMNINYLRLERLPRYEDGWQPILDALRKGAFFVSTGEVLIPAFTVAGEQSGETAALSADGRAEINVDVCWTFPPQFAEVISGDGERVYRERIDLTNEREFGERTLTLRTNLQGRRWVRVEAWDIAANGAFTQPVWLR